MLTNIKMPTIVGILTFMRRINFMLKWGSLKVHITCIIWASWRENLSSEVCEQQKRRPASASAQSGQRLRYSLFGKYHIKTCFKGNSNFLASPCSWAGWFESHYIGNLEDRLCRHEAHIKLSYFSSEASPDTATPACCQLCQYSLRNGWKHSRLFTWDPQCWGIVFIWL